MKVVDSFLIASGKRKVDLIFDDFADIGEPSWYIEVFVLNKSLKRISQKWITLSKSAYMLESNARHAFETRRPMMRDEPDANSMYGRGKRMVQEVMTEKLGPMKGQ